MGTRITRRATSQVVSPPTLGTAGGLVSPPRPEYCGLDSDL